MLEILINSQQLDLPTDIAIPFVNENPLFLQERIPVEHTINFHVPKTPNNMKLFAHPDRPTAAQLTIDYPTVIKHFGITIMEGTIFIINTAEFIELQFISAQIPSRLKRPINRLEIGDEYSFGQGTYINDPDDPNYTDADIWAEEYAQTIHDAITDPEEFTVAPIKIADKEWENSEAAFGVENALALYINPYNPNPRTHIDEILIPQSITNHLKLMPGGGGKSISPDGYIVFADYVAHKGFFPTIPQPYIYYILNEVMGDVLLNNPFEDDPNLKRLVMIAKNHPSANTTPRIQYIHDIPPEHTPTDPERTHLITTIPYSDSYKLTNDVFDIKWKLTSFMQDYPFNEFLKSILSLFGLSCFFHQDKMELIYDEELLLTTETFDLTPFLVDDMNTYYERGKNYYLNYGRDKNTDTNMPETEWAALSFNDAYIKTMMDETPTTRIVSIKDMKNAVYEMTKVAVGIPKTGQEQPFEVKSTMLSSPLETNKEAFNRYNNPLGEEGSQEPPETLAEHFRKEIYDLRIETTPLDMNIEHTWPYTGNFDQEYIFKDHWVTPIIHEQDISSPPNIMLDLGYHNILGISLTEVLGEPSYRQLSNTNITAKGYKVGNLSLIIDENNPDSVFKFHKHKARWQEKDKTKIKVTAILTPLQNKQITNKMKIHIAGKNFHIIRREYNLTHHNHLQVQFELIEAFSVL